MKHLLSIEALDAAARARIDGVPSSTRRMSGWALKVKPASWKEMFFPNMHTLPGS